MEKSIPSFSESTVKSFCEAIRKQNNAPSPKCQCQTCVHAPQSAKVTDDAREHT